ncbi:MAG: DUF4230 domain-containing protein [Firmicutes bacterium]|jgi:hypothetical protein|nr:DUF4230 domain-containing protein [Bacillota bacterium]
MQEDQKNRIRLISIAALAVVIIILLVIGLTKKQPEMPPAASLQPQVEIQTVEKEKIVEVEKKITSEIIQDGLNNMGFLISQEYYFTEVVEYSSIKTLLKINIPFTQSGYLISYDGIVEAGIDMTQAKVKKDDDQRTITITLPQPVIKSVSIDFDSFQVYSEKESIFNPITVEDYNNSLKELEATAREKAVERGVLEQAEKNARVVISGFISGLVDLGNDYHLSYTIGK